MGEGALMKMIRLKDCIERGWCTYTTNATGWPARTVGRCPMSQTHTEVKASRGFTMCKRRHKQDIRNMYMIKNTISIIHIQTIYNTEVKEDQGGWET